MHGCFVARAERMRCPFRARESLGERIRGGARMRCACPGLTSDWPFRPLLRASLARPEGAVRGWDFNDRHQRCVSPHMLDGFGGSIFATGISFPQHLHDIGRPTKYSDCTWEETLLILSGLQSKGQTPVDPSAAKRLRDSAPSLGFENPGGTEPLPTSPPENDLAPYHNQVHHKPMKTLSRQKCPSPYRIAAYRSIRRKTTFYTCSKNHPHQKGQLFS